MGERRHHHGWHRHGSGSVVEVEAVSHARTSNRAPRCETQLDGPLARRAAVISRGRPGPPPPQAAGPIDARDSAGERDIRAERCTGCTRSTRPRPAHKSATFEPAPARLFRRSTATESRVSMPTCLIGGPTDRCRSSCGVVSQCQGRVSLGRHAPFGYPTPATRGSHPSGGHRRTADAKICGMRLQNTPRNGPQ